MKALKNNLKNWTKVNPGLSFALDTTESGLEALEHSFRPVISNALFLFQSKNVWGPPIHLQNSRYDQSKPDGTGKQVWSGSGYILPAGAP